MALGALIAFSRLYLYVPYIFMAVIAIVFILGITKKNFDYRKVAVNTFVITVINLTLSFIIEGIYYVDRPFVNYIVDDCRIFKSICWASLSYRCYRSIYDCFCDKLDL